MGAILRPELLGRCGFPMCAMCGEQSTMGMYCSSFPFSPDPERETYSALLLSALSVIAIPRWDCLSSRLPTDWGQFWLWLQGRCWSLA